MIIRELDDVFYFTPAILCGEDDNDRLILLFCLWCWSVEFTFWRGS